MGFWIGFIPGVFLGNFIGVIIVGVLMASKNLDDYDDENDEIS